MAYLIDRDSAPIIVNSSVARTREYFTGKEVEKLMEAARKSSRHGHRDATMILIAYRHGLRASEVCDLQWCDTTSPGGKPMFQMLGVLMRTRRSQQSLPLCLSFPMQRSHKKSTLALAGSESGRVTINIAYTIALPPIVSVPALIS